MANAVGFLAFFGLMTAQAAGALFACMTPWHRADRDDIIQHKATTSTSHEGCESGWLHAA
jgi:hypothetical protein